MNKEEIKFSYPAHLQLLKTSHGQRCYIQGCVYIPDRDGNPTNLCNYCGEPAPHQPNSFFGEPVCDLSKFTYPKERKKK